MSYYPGAWARGTEAPSTGPTPTPSHVPTANPHMTRPARARRARAEDAEDATRVIATVEVYDPTHMRVVRRKRTL